MGKAIDGFELVVCGFEQGLEERPGFAEDFEHDLGMILGDGCSVNSEYRDIGKGASLEILAFSIVIYTVVSSAVKLFLSGKKIEENLDAWPKLFERFTNFIERKKKSNEINAIHVSLPLALGHVIGSLVNSDKSMETFELISQTSISLDPQSDLIGGQYESFIDNPFRAYNLVLLTDSKKLHFIGIKSTLEYIYDKNISLY